LKLFNYFWLKFVKVDIENPIALHFIMQDELFFLNEDREAYSNAVEKVAVVETVPVADTETSVAEVVPALEITPIAFNFKGSKGGMLILVHYPELEFIHETHLTALENILKRKDVAINDVAILNMANYGDVNFENITGYFTPQKILLLGEKALPAGIAALKLNTPQQLGKSTALYSFSFDEMMDSPDNKKAFWEQMKGF
jgi:hypothetical protein